MASPNLNEVTDALTRLIEAVVTGLLGGTPVTVSSLPPERADEFGDSRLNLYLHHVAVDTDGGPDLIRGAAVGPVPTANRPLALKLFYVLTAHAMIDNVEDSSGQQTLMGWGMKALHDNPVVTSQLTIGATQIFPTIGDQELGVMLRRVTPEEAISFWATDQVRTARLSAYYEVGTLLLPPESPSAAPGVTTQVMLSVLPSGRATLRATRSAVRFALPATLGGATLAPERSPAVVALKAVADGDSAISAQGQGLGGGNDAAVVLRGESTTGVGLPGDAAVLRPGDNPAWNITVSDTALDLALRPTGQAETAAGVVPVDLLPGSYTLALLRSLQTRSEDGHVGRTDVESNRQPFALAPYVVDAVLDAGAHVIVTVDAAYDATAAAAVPQLSIGGDLYRLVTAFAGTPADAGTFLVVDASHYEAVPLFNPAASGRTYPVRLSVNGVDAQPIWLEVA